MLRSLLGDGGSLAQPESGGMPRLSRTRSAALAAVANIVAPMVVYYGLRAAGVSQLTALLVTSVPPALHAGITAVRTRTADVIGLLVLIGILSGVVTALLSGSPRDLLVRNAWVSAALSIGALATLRAERPLTFVMTRAVLPHRMALMDRLWDTDDGFRAAWRRITISWGAALVVDAGLRVLIALRAPVDLAPSIDLALVIVTVLVMQVPTHVILWRAGVWHRLFARGPVAGRGSRGVRSTAVQRPQPPRRGAGSSGTRAPGSRPVG